MSESSAWRFECCNKLLNALADDARASLSLTTIPFSRKGSAGVVFTLVVINNGRVLATCRHEMNSNNELHWISHMTTVFCRAAIR